MLHNANGARNPLIFLTVFSALPIDIHAAWNAATQEREATSEDLPELRVRARTLPALTEAIVRLLGPDSNHLFQLIALARNRKTRKPLH